ncbi:Glycosyltransferase involved in cell wall bisynthesis [Melghirimyces thermohalophilus]|uniref:Glycosyltransferase involved in cell wall bisynthesis n=1 Tax=Melghirimyces thermohalophilus TaxID=1236220 RepID=A0A1G6MFL0_9BACL|nr:glycosyltransferase family 4 protein [Melghirimyces thermohalophilus]SDC53735.1 Glycosyltransferase involved in cell wall bisynthesis [Melghirimyces thermohalophilus]
MKKDRMNGKIMMFSSVHSYNDSRVFHKEAVSLAKAGYQVELHALADFEQKEEKGVRIVGLPRPKNKLTRLLGGWRLFRRALGSGADRFHFHDPELLPWGVLLRWITRRPVIYDAHEDLPKQIYTKPWIPTPLKGVLSRLANLMEKGMARRLSAVVTATEPIANHFASCRRVEVIKNYPLPFPPVSPKREEDSVHRILYVGGVSYLRGYREMLKMMEYLPPELNAELHLIGPLQHIDEEDRQVEALREKGIHLHGSIPFEEVQKWLSVGKVGLVCLHPVENYRESLPIKMFEYMAAGLPVVATDFPLWREIVEGSGAGVTVDPLSPQAIAREVTRILREDTVRQRMGEKGKAAHRDIYNWQVEEKKLIQLYQQF